MWRTGQIEDTSTTMAFQTSALLVWNCVDVLAGRTKADRDYTGRRGCHDRDVAFDVKCDVYSVESIRAKRAKISATVKNTEYAGPRNGADYPRGLCSGGTNCPLHFFEVVE